MLTLNLWPITKAKLQKLALIHRVPLCALVDAMVDFAESDIVTIHVGDDSTGGELLKTAVIRLANGQKDPATYNAKDRT